jgi:hypothetical protein
MDMWEKPMANNSSHLSDEISGDAHIVSFVVPIWKDESPIEGQKEIWPGHITQIPNGARHYFTNFDEIPEFMQDYLNSLK